MVWEMWEFWEMWETVTNLKFAWANSTLNRENMEILVKLWILSGFTMGFKLKNIEICNNNTDFEFSTLEKWHICTIIP